MSSLSTRPLSLDPAAGGFAVGPVLWPLIKGDNPFNCNPLRRADLAARQSNSIISEPNINGRGSIRHPFFRLRQSPHLAETAKRGSQE